MRDRTFKNSLIWHIYDVYVGLVGLENSPNLQNTLLYFELPDTINMKWITRDSLQPEVVQREMKKTYDWLKVWYGLLSLWKMDCYVITVPISPLGWPRRVLVMGNNTIRQRYKQYTWSFNVYEKKGGLRCGNTHLCCGRRLDQKVKSLKRIMLEVWG